MRLPPGPRYLLHLIPQLTLPPLFTLVALHVLSLNVSAPLPLYAQILAFALSWPLAFALLVQWRSWANRWNAASRGAVMPEEVEHKLPGSVDLLMKMFENDKSLYLGESPPSCLLGWCVSCAMGAERMHVVDGMRAWCARVEVRKLKEIITDCSHEPVQEHREIRQHVQLEGYVRG